ncbi:MAG TPA: alpha-amylase family glycosyl hydrolase [Sphingorhabdus sp.]|nr:alpha-amylase family glycosyl hydrolase [Sphingorhabdus sp.]
MMRKLLLAAALAATAISPLAAQSFRDRLPEDEVIYFVLPDRFANGDPKNDTGGIKGDRMKHGFDPTHKGFYQGGDLKGLTERLEYIQSLGMTAIWFAPIFKNKPVQGGPGQETAGYHGYWVTDFTSVDPHFGTNEEFKAFVEAAHARGMKVYMDIITNHTADVIQYKECPTSACAYRSRADFPYSRRAADGAPINPGFEGDRVRTAENFAKLTDMNFAYTPVVPKAEANVKVPAWLNDIRYYHNRGDTTFRGENSTMGDFVGLDDLYTENPRVVDGFIEIYGSWIDKYGIDGFRIDTAKHVNPEFWQKFAPAIMEKAKARGIPNFHIFGEVANDGANVHDQAYYTRVAGLPSVLDFAFRRAAIEAVGGRLGTEVFNQLIDADALYAESTNQGRRLPIFLGNHDNGRFAREMRLAQPNADDAETLKRVQLGHAIMFTMRGVPTIYSGDEQGFAGDGNDQDARETLFASKVAVYLDNKLVGTQSDHNRDNFSQSHPVYMTIAQLAELRTKYSALRRGEQIIRNYSEKPGLLAYSRVDQESGEEILAVFNTSTEPLNANVEVETKVGGFETLAGNCPSAVRAPGSASFNLAPLGYAICLVK